MNFPWKRESTPFLGGGNPVLGRELRQTLRNERAFALMAIYVSILGAVVASLFPADQAIAVNDSPTQTGAGFDLFWKFILWQALFIVLVLPALAAGALAQERERGTLESFLLTPLTPAEIVWGKAAGVLCFGGLLLAATLPLTSLSFLLGGVSPADIITAYILLLALAAFVTGFGLYCSARWTNTVKAMVACYCWLPAAIICLVGASGIGSLVAGITIILGSFWTALRALPRWKASQVGKRLGFVADLAFYLGMVLVFVALVLTLAGSYGLGLRLFIVVFMTPYVLYVAKLGLEHTGIELARLREPEGPVRERLGDLHADWQRAIEEPQPPVTAPQSTVPGPTERFTDSPQSVAARMAPPLASGHLAPTDTGWADLAPTAAAKPVAVSAAAVGAGVGAGAGTSAGTSAAAGANAAAIVTQHSPAVTARPGGAHEERRRAAARRRMSAPHNFLPDGWNPVFTREMRRGLLGRWTWIARAGYSTLIAGQLYIVLRLGVPYLLGEGNFGWAWSQIRDEWPGLAKLHVVLLLLAGAIFGARAFAPEREQKTLPQLLTTPLPNRSIIGGKLMAALAYTGYAYLLGAPLTLLMMSLFVVTPAQGFRFLAMEVLLATFAASWGLFCSMRGFTMRRALGWSVGGIGALIGAELIASLLDSTSQATVFALHLLPLSLVPGWTEPGATPSTADATALAVYALITTLLLVVTTADFKKYATQG